MEDDNAHELEEAVASANAARLAELFASEHTAPLANPYMRCGGLTCTSGASGCQKKVLLPLDVCAPGGSKYSLDNAQLVTCSESGEFRDWWDTALRGESGAPPVKTCVVCWKQEDEEGLIRLRCSKCKVAYYCSRECQMHHWDAHKALCKAFSEQAQAAREQAQAARCRPAAAGPSAPDAMDVGDDLVDIDDAMGAALDDAAPSGRRTPSTVKKAAADKPKEKEDGELNISTQEGLDEYLRKEQELVDREMAEVNAALIEK